MPSGKCRCFPAAVVMMTFSGRHPKLFFKFPIFTGISRHLTEIAEVHYTPVTLKGFCCNFCAQIIGAFERKTFAGRWSWTKENFQNVIFSHPIFYLMINTIGKLKLRDNIKLFLTNKKGCFAIICDLKKWYLFSYPIRLWCLRKYAKSIMDNFIPLYFGVQKWCKYISFSRNELSC